jgi:hypothetical protein
MKEYNFHTRQYIDVESSTRYVTWFLGDISKHGYIFTSQH